MLRPIVTNTANDALALLREGFAHHSEAFWRTALARVFERGWNTQANVPVGHLLMEGGVATGVILTPATLRRAPDGEVRRVVNLSSWYVRPEQRWRAVPMLRTVLNSTDAIYTDLTPTPDVIRVLSALGFVPLNRGLVIDPLPFTAFFGKASGPVVDLAAVPADGLPADERAMLLAHVQLGCIAAAFQDDAGWCPLLFKRRTLRRLPSASLVYCGSNQRGARRLGAIARFLLRHGCLLLVRDARDDEPQPHVSRRVARGLKFAKYTPNDAWFFEHRTDFAGSELCLLDL